MPSKINDGLTNDQRWALRNPEKEIQRRYRQKHRLELLMKGADYREKNREKIREYYQAHKESRKASASASYHKKKHLNEFKEKRRIASAIQATMLKEVAINMYSNGDASCKWCGMADMDVLCLDHIADGGGKHRKTMRSTTYAWLKRNDYPVGLFQVLCMNCNWKKHVMKARTI